MTMRKTFLLLVFLFSLSLSAQTRDYWSKTERKGTAYAYQHVTVAKLPDGNIRYDYSTHIKTDVAGMNPQDIVMSGFYIVDPELRPLKFETRAKFQAKETYTSGVCAAGKMTVTEQEKGGSPRKKEISLGDAYFNIVLEDLIARRADRKGFTVNLFEASDQKPDPTRVDILKVADSEIEASVKGRLFTSTYRISRDGQLRESRLIELGTRTYVTDAKDAQNIAYLNTGDGFTLTVRSQKSFPNVYRVSRAQLQVRWKKIPFEDFRLEDNRQKIVRKGESGGQYEVVLEIARPVLVPDAPATHTPDSIYLGEDEFIKPNDPGIRRQATAITGDLKSHAEIVRKMLTWVNTNVVGELISETLTGPEVLEKKRGKCSEYAILFASLARAAGIPTRIALGESYTSSAWVGHMWNEVWLGEWIAADPSSGNFVTGPSHLKFIDSPTVNGTQGVRFKLVDNLQIEILGFEQEKSRTGLKTGISGSTYVNANFACKISAPDDTWSLKEEDKRSGAPVLSMKPANGEIEFALVMFAVPPGTSAPTILDGRLGAIAKMVKNFRLIEKGEAEVAGRKAPSAVFAQGDAKTIVNRNILMVDGSSAYLFALLGPEEKMTGSDTVFKKIVASFEVVNE